MLSEVINQLFDETFLGDCVGCRGKGGVQGTNEGAIHSLSGEGYFNTCLSFIGYCHGIPLTEREISVEIQSIEICHP